MAQNRDPAQQAQIDAYLLGQPSAFEEVDGWIRSEIRRSYPRLGDELEDVSQTVHGKLLRNFRAGRYEGRSALRTYVTGIVHHTAIDRLRDLYRERALSEVLVHEPGPVQGNPYETADALDQSRLLHQVLLALPAACRELWRLVFVEKLSYAEIGARLSIPPGTVKSRMWHCRRKAMEAFDRLKRRLSTSRRNPWSGRS